MIDGRHGSGYCQPVSGNAETKSAVQLDVSPPRRFTTGAVLIVSAFGLVSVLPFFIAILAMSVLSVGVQAFLVLSLVILLLGVSMGAFLLPLGFGNPYLVHLVRSFQPAGQERDGFIVQLRMSPRLRTGLRALVEDADDIGCLSFQGSVLVYQGDSVKLSIPFDQIKQVEARNIGLRGLYVYGRRIALSVSGLPNVDWLEFTERSSLLLPGSRKTAQALYERLRATRVNQPQAAGRQDRR